MRAGWTDDDSVNVAPHEVVVIEEAPLGPYLVLVAYDVEQSGRDVAQSADLEVGVELAQVRKMLDLGDRAAADDTNL